MTREGSVEMELHRNRSASNFHVATTKPTSSPHGGPTAHGQGPTPEPLADEELLARHLSRSRLTTGFARPPLSARQRREERTERRRRCVRVLGVVAILAAGSVLAVVFRNALLRAALWIGTLPTVEGGTCYALLVTAWLLALLPTSLLEVLGGFVFGFWEGAVCSTVGKMLGSFISFYVGRRYQDWARVRLLGLPQSPKAASTVASAASTTMTQTFSPVSTTTTTTTMPSSAGGDAAPQWGDGRFPHHNGGGHPHHDDDAFPRFDDDDDGGTGHGNATGFSVRYVAGLRLALRARPFSTCLALRLAYVPEAVQNFTPAVLDAPFAPFAAATLLGSSAYALLWAKLGSSLKDVKDVAKDGWTTEKIVFSVVGAASLVVVLLLVRWNTNRMLKRFSGGGALSSFPRESPLHPHDHPRHHHFPPSHSAAVAPVPGGGDGVGTSGVNGRSNGGGHADGVFV
eukprot:CAMPEP_0185697496 /NCGR_PEP_ID=MMETSP1164-20130828/5783_1 /TAXON_ID=1104430 /ORGANISM="Chrysoreinhardia sp, Strain CCMP2950" /LENGTH=456 /DNA_ID=CAMNT_0028364393 /DNA_START=97 /DNA_END=1467 /DNA_ORIENTATION=+